MDALYVHLLSLSPFNLSDVDFIPTPAGRIFEGTRILVLRGFDFNASFPDIL